MPNNAETTHLQVERRSSAVSAGPAFARGLWRIAAADVSSGNAVTLLHDGPATFDVMCEAIAAARETVVLEAYILRSDDKKRARLNCLAHILSLIPYKKLPRPKIKLPERSNKGAYDDQASLKGRKFVPEKY